MAGGLMWLALCLVAMSLMDASTSEWTIRGLMFATGAGMAFVIMPQQAATFATISSADTGRASAIYNTQRQTAAALDTHAGHVRAGDIVLLRTDWPRRCPVASERFWKDAPYTGRGACEWLVARGVRAVGYDYPPDYCIRTSIFSPETPIAREECTTHHVFFPAGVTVIEYLTNLDQIGAARCRFIALPLRVTGADGSPVRAIALVD